MLYIVYFTLLVPNENYIAILVPRENYFVRRKREHFALATGELFTVLFLMKIT